MLGDTPPVGAAFCKHNPLRDHARRPVEAAGDYFGEPAPSIRHPEQVADVDELRLELDEQDTR